MQQALRHYSRAPITEAILDLKVILPDNFPIEKFLLYATPDPARGFELHVGNQ